MKQFTQFIGASAMLEQFIQNIGSWQFGLSLVMCTLIWRLPEIIRAIKDERP